MSDVMDRGTISLVFFELHCSQASHQHTSTLSRYRLDVASILPNEVYPYAPHLRLKGFSGLLRALRGNYSSCSCDVGEALRSRAAALTTHDAGISVPSIGHLDTHPHQAAFRSAVTQADVMPA